MNPARALEEYGKAVRELEDALGSASKPYREKVSIPSTSLCLSWSHIQKRNAICPVPPRAAVKQHENRFDQSPDIP